MKIFIPTISIHSLISDRVPNIIVNNRKDKFVSVAERELDFVKIHKINYLKNNNLIIDIPCNEKRPKVILAKISYECFKMCVNIFKIIVNNSYTKDGDSYIIQAFLGDQAKLTNSIFFMNKCGLYGQMYLIRSILEDCATVGWLLNDNKGSINDRINQYKGHTFNQY